MEATFPSSCPIQTDANLALSENCIDHITENVCAEVEDHRTVSNLEGCTEDINSTLTSNTLEHYPVDIQTEADVDVHKSDNSGRVSGDVQSDDSGEYVLPMLAQCKLEEQASDANGTASSPEETPSASFSQRYEDVTTESWRQHRKHVFVLSEAGKPIYSRYGSEEALSSTMGVMMALVSFIQSGDNVIRSVCSGINPAYHNTLNLH